MPAHQPSALVPEAFERFGDLLRFLRRRAHLTQRELSIAVGYNFAHISRLEASHRLPDPAVIAAVFVPALELEDAPEWAARLIELANQAARQQLDTATAIELGAPPAPQPAPPARPGMALLATKLYLPRARRDVVPRPRLLKLLDRAWSAPLAVLSAPAGSGKTTLLAAWLAETTVAAAFAPQPAAGGAWAAWLSLDAGDNDPITWLGYFVAACQVLLPGAGATTLAMLKLPQAPPLPMLLTPLLNDLLALPGDAVLVLDDYHLIVAQPIHDALLFVLDHMPPALHLVIASRTEPRLPLARLRGRHAVAELHAAELRFTPDESFVFLNDTMGLDLTAAEVDLLDARTEGWVAGLQLAALALHGRADRVAFLESFSGNNRFVADYLAAEVLERLPAHLRTFVMQTAVLERLCAPLCDAVLGIGDQMAASRAESSTGAPRPPSSAAYSQLILDELERQHLFLVPLDDERRWYRYHHMFGEMLLALLRGGASPAEIDGLHERASRWYAQQGQVAEAVHHLLAGHRWQQAAEIIEIDGLPMVVRGQIHTVLGWLKRLPAEEMRTRPLLAHGYAVALMATNQFAAARAIANDAERHLPPDIGGDFAGLVRGRLVGVRGHIAFITGDSQEAKILMKDAFSVMPVSSAHPKYGPMIAMTRSAIDVYGLAIDLALTGDVSAATEQRAMSGIASSTASGNTSAVLNGSSYLAFIYMLQGRLHAAAATYARVKQLMPGDESSPLLFGTPAYYVGMGELHYRSDECGHIRHAGVTLADAACCYTV